MARYLAVCEKPGIDEEQFKQAFDRVRKWRIGRRTWVVKAYCDLSTGKLAAECEAPDKAPFEEWLKNNGWKVEEILDVKLIHEAGAVWPV
jgi:hypothetical protein